MELHDLRYAVRSLRKSPAFTTIAVLTLGLGIGATTAVYALVDAVILRPLPCPSPERVFMVVEAHPERGRMLVRPANYDDWRGQMPWLERSGMAFETDFVLTRESRHVKGALADEGFFATWGVPARLGRTFDERDFRAAVSTDWFGRRGLSAVLGYGFWQREYASDPHVIGRTITLDGAVCTIVGVMPAAFRAIANDEVFVPWIFGPKEWAERRFHYFPVVARLKPQVSPAQAQRDLAAAYRGLAATHPEDADWSAQLVAPRDLLLGSAPEMLTLVFGAVWLVLLIGCANVASLVLARGVMRRKETAVRLALGCGRARLIVSQIAESSLLAMLGAFVALGVATVSLRVVASLPAISTLPFTYVPSLDWRVIGFASATAVATVLLVSCIPAAVQSRVDLLESIKAAPGFGRILGYHRARAGLVIVEVALAIVVTSTALLMARSLVRLQQVDPGVRTGGILAVRIEPPAARSAQQTLPEFYSSILDRVRALPGVEIAGLTGYVPLTDPGRTWRFAIEGRAATGGGDDTFAVPAEVSRGFFEVFGIGRVDGRLFDATDRAGSADVVVVNRTAARRYWPDTTPIGRRIRIAGMDRWFSVIGIVADVHQASLEQAPAPMLYTLIDQTPDTSVSTTLIVRPAASRLSPASAVRHAIQSVDALAIIDDMRSMDDVRGDVLREPRFRATLLGTFTAVALLLGGIGIYGIVAQFSSERRRELAIRNALGATATELRMFAVMNALRLVGAGLCVGLLLAVGVSRLIQHSLFQVGALDVPSFALATLTFVAVAAAAAWIPARRAARVDPMSALRTE